MGLPEPLVRAINVHGPTMRITGWALEHRSQILDQQVDMLCIDGDKGTGAYNETRVDFQTRGSGILKGCIEHVNAIEHAPFDGLELLCHRAES